MKKTLTILSIIILWGNLYAQDNSKYIVNFNSGSFTINKQSKLLLDKVTNSLPEDKRIIIELHGHTDSIGRVSFNDTLSKQRIEAVKVFFQKTTDIPIVFVEKAFGERQPLNNIKTNKKLAKNRRVEIYISFKSAEKEYILETNGVKALINADSLSNSQFQDANFQLLLDNSSKDKIMLNIVADSNTTPNCNNVKIIIPEYLFGRRIIKVSPCGFDFDCKIEHDSINKEYVIDISCYGWSVYGQICCDTKIPNYFYRFEFPSEIADVASYIDYSNKTRDSIIWIKDTVRYQLLSCVRDSFILNSLGVYMGKYFGFNANISNFIVDTVYFNESTKIINCKVPLTAYEKIASDTLVTIKLPRKNSNFKAGLILDIHNKLLNLEEKNSRTYFGYKNIIQETYCVYNKNEIIKLSKSDINKKVRNRKKRIIIKIRKSVFLKR